MKNISKLFNLKGLTLYSGYKDWKSVLHEVHVAREL